MQKVLAYRHSQEVDGKRVKQEEVEILEYEDNNNIVVLTQDGIKCTAVYNVFSGAYYASDVFGVISKPDMEM